MTHVMKGCMALENARKGHFNGEDPVNLLFEIITEVINYLMEAGLQ